MIIKVIIDYKNQKLVYLSKKLFAFKSDFWKYRRQDLIIIFGQSLKIPEIVRTEIVEWCTLKRSVEVISHGLTVQQLDRIFFGRVKNSEIAVLHETTYFHSFILFLFGVRMIFYVISQQWNSSTNVQSTSKVLLFSQYFLQNVLRRVKRLFVFLGFPGFSPTEQTVDSSPGRIRPIPE